METLLNLFASILLENSVIVVGDNLKDVTGVIMGLKQLVQPLQWCLTMVPIVPCDLIDTVYSPFPILAGITINEYKEILLDTMSEEEIDSKTWVFLPSKTTEFSEVRVDLASLDGPLPQFSFNNIRDKLAQPWAELKEKLYQPRVFSDMEVLEMP